MGEAKRRGKPKPTIRQQPTIDQFAEESNGILTCNLIRKHHSFAVKLFEFDLQTWFRMLQHREAKPPLCALCDAEFRWPEQLPDSFFRMAPANPLAREVIVTMTGICHNCAAVPDAELLRHCVEATKKGLFPGLRVLDIHPTGGSA